MSEYTPELTAAKSDWLITAELASLEQRYASGEILGMPAHCLIGTEIDYAISMNHPTAEQQAALESTRNSIATELSWLAPKDKEQEERRAQWLQQIPQLKPEELINFQIYKRLSVPTLDAPSSADYLGADDSPETTLEFVFGNGLYQTGYYDTPDYFEMRTQAAKPTIAMERIGRATRIADEVARSFGGKFRYVGDQTNVSVWTEDNGELRPVHALDNPEGQEIARRATAGILQATRDSNVVFYEIPLFSTPSDQRVHFTANADRNGRLRVLPERFEQRRTIGAKKHPLGALVLLAGFAHGVADPTAETDFVHIQQRDLLVPGPGYQKERDLYLLRALQTSLTADGRFDYTEYTGLNINRTEGMLSSIIGAAVQERVNARRALQDLLGSISLHKDGTLTADEQAFQRVLDAPEAYSILILGEPQETISERLQRIQRISAVATISGVITGTFSSGITMHQDLEEFRTAPSLAYITAPTREAVHEQLGSTFTHEEAVAHYYLEASGFMSKPLKQRITDLRALESDFPKADAAVVTRIIRDNLQQDATEKIESVAFYKEKAAASPSDDALKDYAWHKSRYDAVNDLLKAMS